MMELPDTPKRSAIGRSHRSNEQDAAGAGPGHDGAGDRKSSAMIARRTGDGRCSRRPPSSGQFGGDFFDLGIDDGPGPTWRATWRTCKRAYASTARSSHLCCAEAFLLRRPKFRHDFANAYDTGWLRLRAQGFATVAFFNCPWARPAAQRHIYAVFSACPST